MMDNSGFVKQAFAYASFVGKVQGLFQFVKTNPGYYSAEDIVERVDEITSEMNAALGDIVPQD